MIDEPKAIESIADLTPDERNARKHNPRNIGMIMDSLQQVGAARSIVVDEDGKILAGHGVIEAAAEAGIERVQVVDADGETIIAVRRSGLTAEQKVKLALYDNRTAELAEWDAEVLSELGAEIDLSEYWRPWEMSLLTGQYEDGQDPSELWQGMPEFEQEEQASYQTIKIHFANAQDVGTFAELIGQAITDKTKWLWFPRQEPMNLLACSVEHES